MALKYLFDRGKKKQKKRKKNTESERKKLRGFASVAAVLPTVAPASCFSLCFVLPSHLYLTGSSPWLCKGSVLVSDFPF
ncbi:unnamed protein product [Arabidopsis halleri]